MEEMQEYKRRMLMEPITIKHTPIQFKCGSCGRLIDCEDFKYHFCPESIEDRVSLPLSRDWDEILMWSGIWALIASFVFVWCFFFGWDQLYYILLGALITKVFYK